MRRCTGSIPRFRSSRLRTCSAASSRTSHWWIPHRSRRPDQYPSAFRQHDCNNSPLSRRRQNFVANWGPRPGSLQRKARRYQGTADRCRHHRYAGTHSPSQGRDGHSVERFRLYDLCYLARPYVSRLKGHSLYSRHLRVPRESAASEQDINAHFNCR